MSVANKQKVLSRKQKVTAGATALVFVGGGAAFAFWTITGQGTGTVTTADPTALVILQDDPGVALTPGGPSVPLTGTFNNLNSGPLTIPSFTATITSVTKALDAPAGECTVNDYALTDNTAVVTGGVVPAGNDVGAWTDVTIAMNNTAANQDGCKGATVNLSYTTAPLP